MKMLDVNVRVSTYLPGFNYVASNREKSTAGVERKNKVGDRILPPVVRTVGLMKMRKDNMKHSSRRLVSFSSSSRKEMKKGKKHVSNAQP